MANLGISSNASNISLETFPKFLSAAQPLPKFQRYICLWIKSDGFPPLPNQKCLTLTTLPPGLPPLPVSDNLQCHGAHPPPSAPRPSRAVSAFPDLRPPARSHSR